MKPFFDTNILVYAQTADTKGHIARELLTGGGTISVQVLNEFANVMRKKFTKSWAEIRLAIADIEIALPNIRAISIDTHHKAMAICQAHGLSLYDALIVAAAAEEGCDCLWTEDLHHGTVIDGVNIQNPFR